MCKALMIETLWQKKTLKNHHSLMTDISSFSRFLGHNLERITNYSTEENDIGIFSWLPLCKASKALRSESDGQKKTEESSLTHD